ncbi:MAG TPA: glycosyltransferase family 39 protein [Patescibacteria group bacterium]|nr:glycosyltransferase family 39 protein [Patescibacteria group bacterium]
MFLTKKTGLIIVIVLLILMFAFIIKEIFPYANVLWDEAEFLLQTYWTVKPIQLHDWVGVLTQLHNQISYPPLQYAILAPILDVIGFSIEKARIVSMIFPFITGVLIYVLGIQVGQSVFSTKKQLPQLVGLLAVVFFVTSPVLLYLHTIILKEPMSTTWTILAILVYFKARTSKKLQWFLLTGVLVAISFLTKYPYGIMNLAFFGIEACISLVTAKNGKERVHLITSHLLILLPVVIGALLWVATSPERFNQFLYIIENNEIPNEMAGWDLPTYLFYYPKGIVYMYGITIPVGIVLLASFIFSTQYIKKLKPRLLWLSFVTYVIFLTPHMINLQERYIAPVSPGLFILVSIVLIDVVRRSFKSPLWTRIVVCTLAIGLGIHILISLKNLPIRVYDVGTKTIFAIAFNQPDVNPTWFDYNTAAWGKLSPALATENPKDILTWVFNRIDTTKPVYVKGRFTELSPPYFLLSVLTEKDHSKPKNLPYKEYYVTLTVLPTSRYYTHEYRLINEWVQWEVQTTAADPSLTLVDAKTFKQLGISVSIYGRL